MDADVPDRGCGGPPPRPRLLPRPAPPHQEGGRLARPSREAAQRPGGRSCGNALAGELLARRARANRVPTLARESSEKLSGPLQTGRTLERVSRGQAFVGELPIFIVLWGDIVPRGSTLQGIQD